MCKTNVTKMEERTIYTRLFENLKGRVLKSIITWSEMGQQSVQAKEGLLTAVKSRYPLTGIT